MTNDFQLFQQLASFMAQHEKEFFNFSLRPFVLKRARARAGASAARITTLEYI